MVIVISTFRSVIISVWYNIIYFVSLSYLKKKKICKSYDFTLLQYVAYIRFGLIDTPKDTKLKHLNVLIFSLCSYYALCMVVLTHDLKLIRITLYLCVLIIHRKQASLNIVLQYISEDQSSDFLLFKKRKYKK